MPAGHWNSSSHNNKIFSAFVIIVRENATLSLVGGLKVKEIREGWGIYNDISYHILSNLLMKFLAINIKLFGVLWQNNNKKLLVVYHQEVFVFIWITTRRFLFLFWSPPGGFCFYLNDSISYTLIWQFFFCFSWKKMSKWRAKNGLN